MAFPAMPDQETLELAAAGAARALGEDHRATQAMAKAAITMDKADLWQARLELKKLCREQRGPRMVPSGW